MSLKKITFIFVAVIFVESQGQSEICNEEKKMEIVCDCTEPNVICMGLNLTNMNFILPDDTEIVNFARNSLVIVETGLVWPTSIVEINLSQNQICQIKPKVSHFVLVLIEKKFIKSHRDICTYT